MLPLKHCGCPIGTVRSSSHARLGRKPTSTHHLHIALRPVLEDPEHPAPVLEGDKQRPRHTLEHQTKPPVRVGGLGKCRHSSTAYWKQVIHVCVCTRVLAYTHVCACTSLAALRGTCKLIKSMTCSRNRYCMNMHTPASLANCRVTHHWLELAKMLHKDTKKEALVALLSSVRKEWL